jgi:hypothetical protein
MEYNKIVAITGLTGLFELLSSKTDGAIIRSLDDNTTRFVASRVHNFSHLESIEVYTVKENVNLVEIFNAMKQSTTPPPDVKNNQAVKKYFEEVYPDIDFDRVYASDMKKMVKWFDLLKDKVEFKLTEQQKPVEENAAGEPEAVSSAAEQGQAEQTT